VRYEGGEKVCCESNSTLQGHSKEEQNPASSKGLRVKPARESIGLMTKEKVFQKKKKKKKGGRRSAERRRRRGRKLGLRALR